MPEALGGQATPFLERQFQPAPITDQSQQWLGSPTAPPLNQPVDTRLQAGSQGLSGIGIDPALLQLGGVNQRINFQSPEQLMRGNSGGFYTPGSATGGPPYTMAGGSITLPQPEFNVPDAVRQEGLMHEALHNLEMSFTPD
ncbi:MAG: hypothetical protein V4532_15860, partial [Pseudomonadota bacterium]